MENEQGTKAYESKPRASKPAFYAILYDDLRKGAAELGYALALHGTMASDMDIIAVPWTEHAADPNKLVEMVEERLSQTIFKRADFRETLRDHGRLIYTIPIMGDWYIDLSIMPRRNGLPTQHEILVERVNVVNQLIKVISSTGRGLLKHGNKISRFIVDAPGSDTVSFEPDWGDPIHIDFGNEVHCLAPLHHGSTMKGLLYDMCRFLVDGRRRGLYMEHWGYTVEEVVKIEYQAIKLGFSYDRNPDAKKG